jgi:membrane-associated protein
MHSVFEFLKQLVNPESIILHGGLFILLFVVFAETGLFIGFFLPGDSLLFTSGLLCATGILKIHILLLVILIAMCAILGNMVGFIFGKKVGEMLFQRKSDFIFKQEHLQLAKEFYLKHGGMALILCRFLPIIRTFAPIVAGIVKLDIMLFLFYSIVGGIAWVCFLVLSGYFLVSYIPNLKDYLGYIVIFLIAITSIPIILRVIRKKEV